MIDGDLGTKYLNFGVVNSGFIVTPALGRTPCGRFRLRRRMTLRVRDPMSVGAALAPTIRHERTEQPG